MARKKRDTSKKRESILDAALEGFIAEGYEHASMDRIAEIAGASKRTVYNHFSSKEELFLEVVGRMFDEAYELKQIPYDPDRELDEQLTEFVDAKIAVAQIPGWMGMMKNFFSLSGSNPELIRQVMTQVEAEEDTLATWFEAAAADGRVEIPDAKMVSALFWAMVGGVFFWPLLMSGPIKQKQAKLIKSEIVRLFLNSYSSE